MSRKQETRPKHDKKRETKIKLIKDNWTETQVTRKESIHFRRLLE